MQVERIKKIIKHTGKLLQEVLTELFGEKEEINDEKRDP
jgi:hypothetical protein